MKKTYYKNINLIRLLACLSILLYHLNILKGGYLAVCIFFVLSGYLSCVSAFKKEKFSLLSYYTNRLLKLYLPLLIVVFITILGVSLFQNINWINLKPETMSVLLGYNNFWQLNANMDYFSRHINSPFVHLWYISILIQFDLIFPFIYIILRKIGDKINKLIPCIITFVLSVVGTIYFYKIGLGQNIMLVYYSTFTRIFSLFFGVFLGFTHSYYGLLIPKVLKKENISKIIFYIYLLILIALFIFIDFKSIYFLLCMIIVTIIACRLIDYGIINEKETICDKFINSLSKISYEIYLIQYPLIFLFQYIDITTYMKMPIIIFLTILLSYLLHFCINFKKMTLFKSTITILILSVSLCGGYKFYIAKDYTLEMQALEEQLENNKLILETKQQEYEAQFKYEEQEWLDTLNNFENLENQLKNVITNLQIVGIGDSVMLGAIQNLYQEFPNGYFDAEISRTAWVVNGKLKNLKNRNMLGEVIVFNLGANGDCSLECKMEIIKTCEERKVFWINVTNDNEVHFNDKLISLASKYSNLHIIDWETISNNHLEYFIADGIHLTEIGKKAYTKAIYDAIYQVYLEEYNIEKEEIIKQFEEKNKLKISFYGNDILLNSFDYMNNEFENAKFIINEFNYETLKEKIDSEIKNNSLTHNIVFAFDNTVSLNKTQYEELIKLCSGHNIYILSVNENSFNILSQIDYENVTIIDFYNEIQNNNYLLIDKIHLNEEGNKALNEIIKNSIKKSSSS